ncbi:IclR family transcriptional regulator [Methylophaga thalassica]|uniref:IclR family transcriptional regulator n=1 Tax=Methylophaga TaxID=40222 RepID=UPI002E7BBF64|nr:helix-turn-helix domain-containing protein [Methylophaga thalassica]WVI86430.1 helix-turn-helix domain-containing protein [Methylophaga thalassica]
MNKSRNIPDGSGSLNRATIIMTTIARGLNKGSLLTEIISRTGLPRTTVVRTLTMLGELGWVVKDEQSGRFNLGMDLAAMGYSAISRNPIERVAATQLSQLADELNQVVYLSVRSGLDMVCIGRYEGEAVIQVGRGGPGLRGPLGMTQSCFGIFSALPVKEVNEIIEANMKRYHKVEGFDEIGFRQSITETCGRGYGSFSNVILDRAMSGLGVPIRDLSGYPVAGIGTTFISDWLSEQQQRDHVKLMRAAAIRIERNLFKP